MKCAVCQTENREGVKFCAKCGATMSDVVIQADTNLNTCPACENACKPDAKFCPKCGHNFSSEKAPEPVLQQEALKVVSGGTLACPGCGSAVKANAKFCLKCGHSLSNAPSEPIPFSSPAPVEMDSNSKTSVGMQDEAATSQIQPAPLPEGNLTREAPNVAAPLLTSEVKKAKFPAVAVALSVSGLVVAIGIGAFVMHQKRQSEPSVQTNSEMASKTSSALPAAPAAVSKPDVASAAPASESTPHPSTENAVQANVPSPSSEPANAVPATPLAPSAPEQKSAPKVAAIKPKVPQPDAENNTIQKAIKDSLEDGTKCMKSKKYDCAIANANAVLRISPNNARAIEMKRKAKAEQEKALSQINIE